MQYDAIVVGAGLGGLCAAFELCRKGMKTLLLEQHNLPGGYATSFVRGRFEFEPSLHEMPDLRSIKEASGVIRYLKDDAALDIDFLSIPEAYRVILTDDKLNVRVPFGRENIIDVVEQEVPGSRKAVTAYLELCREVQDSLTYLNASKDHIRVTELLRKHGNFIRTGSYTAQEVAEVIGLPSRAMDILYPYWCYLGVPMNRVSFTLWAALLNSYISSGAVIPRDRSHEIASAFIHKIEEAGGTVRLNSRVTSIEVEENRVRSVALATGERITATHIVCNLSPTRVFNSLITPESEVPVMARKNVNSRIHGFGLTVVYLGLDADHKSLGLHDYSYFIAPHMDTARLYESIHDLESRNLMQAAVCLNAANPGCSPEGTTILSLAAGQSAEAWKGITPEHYATAKETVARIMIDQFEKATGADIRNHIEEIEIATPQTFARYTDSWNGLVYGYEPEPWDAVLPRVLSIEDENYIRGLQFCGGYSFRSHGYGSSILSGKAAAERVMTSRESVS